MRILVVEDDTQISAFIAKGLREDGHVVDCVGNGRDGLFMATTEAYAAVVLDRMLPGLDGLTVLRTLRGAGNTVPVLLLTALADVDHRVEGLRAGADDYLVKPFAFDELLARLKALARRRFDDASPRLGAGALTVDTATCLASGPGGAIALSPKEYALLELLLRERGRVHTRNGLFERLYAGSSTASDKVIEVLVSTLRGKLARAGVDGLIETRRGFGYVVA